MSWASCAGDDIRSLNRKRVLANRIVKEVKKIKKRSPALEKALNDYVNHKMWYEKGGN